MKFIKKVAFFDIFGVLLNPRKELNQMDKFYTHEQIGQKIKEARIAKNLTQSDLGDALGVTKAAVARWESGVVKNIKRDMLQMIASKLDMSPLTLIGIKEQKEESRRIIIDERDFTPEQFIQIEQFINFIKSQSKKD